MKGVQAFINAVQRNYDKLCCIVANTATTNTILSAAATEATQLNVLAAVDMMRDYETRLIIDNSDVTWLEVRYWDAQDGTLGAPKYYEPGDTVEGTPSGASSTWAYINPNTYLADIVANTGAILADTDILSTPVTSVPKSILRASGAGIVNIPAGKRRITIANTGKPVIEVDGQEIRRGEIVSFIADGLRDTLPATTYDCLTSEALVITVG